MKKHILHILLIFGVSLMVQAQKVFYNKIIKTEYYLNVVSASPAMGDGIFVCGARNEQGNGSQGKSDGFVIKYDKSANILQSKAFTDANGYGLSNVRELRNGNLIFSYQNTKNQGILVLTKPNFDVIWTLRSASLFFLEVLELKDGNFLATGFLNNAMQLHLISPNGVVLWSNKYSVDMPNVSLGSYEEDNLIKELADGTVIFLLNAGTNVYKGIGAKPKILKIKPSDGSIIWQKEFNSITTDYEYVRDVFEDSDKNLWISQFSISALSGAEAYPGIIKLDKEGNKIWSKKFTSKGGIFLNKRSDTEFEGVWTEPVYSAFVNEKVNIYFTLDQSGAISNLVKESHPFPTSKVWTNAKNLVLIGSMINCKNSGLNFEVILQQRSLKEKSPCAEPASLTLNDSTLVLSLIYKDVKVQNATKPISAAAPLIKDYTLKTYDNTQFCQDTTFIKRCIGDSYAVGKNNYTQDGTYRDTVFTTTCDSVILSNLTFEKLKSTTIDTTICEGKTLNFFGKKYNKAGIYTDTLISALGCDSTITIDLKTKTLEITTSPEVTVKIAEATTLSAEANLPNVTWQWLPKSFLSCSDCAEPIAKPLETTLYTIIGTSKEGCRAEAKLRINVKGGEEIFIPNTFSPNDDGTNDKFTVFANSSIAKIKQFDVYDRWGNLMFENTNFPPNNTDYGWDGSFRGQKSPTGVYVYRIAIEKADGTIKTLNGDVFIK